MDCESSNADVLEILLQGEVLLKKASAEYITNINTEGIFVFGKCSKTKQHFFEWKPETCEVTDSDSLESGWSLVDPISRQSSPHAVSIAPGCGSVEYNSGETDESAPCRKSKVAIRVFFANLRGLELCKNELRLYSKDGSVHSVYLFRLNSPVWLVEYLERAHCIKRNSRNSHFYNFLEETDQDKLQKSFSELDIADIQNRPRAKPYMAMLTKLANVPHQILPLARQDAGMHRTRNVPHPGDRADGLKREADKSTEPAPADNGKKLAQRPVVQRSFPLDAGTWEEVKSPNGSISDPERVKEIIFRGGIKQDIRPELWKYLLGLDIWEHSKQQRDERRLVKTQEYIQMKLQWLKITPTQERNFTGYRERKCQIEKDVKRTDRTYAFFAGDDNPNLAKLQDILMTYVMYNFDLGYVQGMSDLLAPILSLVHNEAESFWCFVGFMRKVFVNFDVDQKGMKLQLEHLRTLLAFVNERLYNYLKDNQSENMYFCFRWLLVWFKREFNNTDIVQLWEVLWTGQPCTNFHLFICVAILDQETDVFINEQFTFTEILKHVNELSGNLNLQATLEVAESIYLQVKRTLETSREPLPELRKIVGEELSPDGSSGSTGSDEDDDSCMSILPEKSPEEQEILQRKLDEACDLSLSYMFF